jgi:hypothetical protein
MRALEALPVDSVPEPKKHPQVAGITRADKVISRVTSILSPLVSPSQIGELQRELGVLVTSAIDVWKKAQSGEYKITANQILKAEHREEWRSQQFDPVLPLSYGEVDFDVISRTRPRILTLFPRILAWQGADLVNDETSIPGSFLPEPDKAPRPLEMCIYPGRGLPEWSKLVVRGNDSRMELDNAVKKAVEDAKKRAYSDRRTLEHSRRESINSTLGPSMGKA